MNEEEKKYYKKREAEYKKWAQEYEKAKTYDEIKYILKKKDYGWPDEKQSIEKLKKFGKDKNVELAVARFCDTREIREKLFFSSKNKQTKLACLEAEDYRPLWLHYLEVDKRYSKFLKVATDEELYAYFTNKNFDHFFIEHILDREKPYDKITEKKYRNIIIILENNPFTKKEPDLDDFNEYDAEGNYQSHDGYGFYLAQKTFEKFKKELAKIKKLRNLE